MLDVAALCCILNRGRRVAFSAVLTGHPVHGRYVKVVADRDGATLVEVEGGK